MPHSRPRPAPHARAALGCVVVVGLAACGSATVGAASRPSPKRASSAEWRALATPRPAPLPGAARISLTEIQILGAAPWRFPSPVTFSLGLTELTAAGLLRRRDVEYVGRRRFTAAVDAARRGEARPPGAPRPGVSPGAQYILSTVWVRFGSDSSHLELRLTDAQSSLVAKTWRVAATSDADPTSVARTIVGSLVEALRQMHRLPAWTDPVPDAAPASYRRTSIPNAAVEDFFRGLAAEDKWDWEAARSDYQAALAQGGSSFVEARAALARAARLRMGGTLGGD